MALMGMFDFVQFLCNLFLCVKANRAMLSLLRYEMDKWIKMGITSLAEGCKGSRKHNRKTCRDRQYMACSSMAYAYRCFLKTIIWKPSFLLRNVAQLSFKDRTNGPFILISI